MFSCNKRFTFEKGILFLGQDFFLGAMREAFSHVGARIFSTNFEKKNSRCIFS